jgi:hypothetical protein
MRALILSAY